MVETPPTPKEIVHEATSKVWDVASLLNDLPTELVMHGPEPIVNAYDIISTDVAKLFVALKNFGQSLPDPPRDIANEIEKRT